MKMIGKRNCTNFPKEIYEKLRVVKKTGDALKYHQVLAREYALGGYVRGILLCYKMGAGKTMAAIAIADNISSAHPDIKIVFVSSKSLHGNFEKELDKYYELSSGKEKKRLVPRYVSMNASNMATQLKRAANDTSDMIGLGDISELPADLHNCVIIVDEAHNIFNAVTNGSKNAIAFYQMVMEARGSTVIFLTGSPVVNDPFELAICYNMIAGYIHEPAKSADEKASKYTLFSEDYEDFHEYFVADKHIKNRGKFMSRIFGLTSFYDVSDPESAALYPIEKPAIIEKLPMSHEQFGVYVNARDREIEESLRPPSRSATATTHGLSKPKGLSSTYRVKSRQFSNFVFPPYASSMSRDARGFIVYEKFPEKLRPETFTTELPKWSAKFAKLTDNVASWIGKGKGLVYSQFLDVGVNLIARILEERHGFSAYGSTAVSGPKYAILSGEVAPEERQPMINLYNSKDNLHGEKLMILFITVTGAEGIDLKCVMHIHIAEPYWNWARIAQIFARGVRMGSHSDLPVKERYVQPYIYLSVYPTTKFVRKETDGAAEKKAKKKEKPEKPEKPEKQEKQEKETQKKQKEPTTDEYLFQRSLENRALIDEFMLAVRDSSIDCMFHSKTPANCFMCAPTNRPLFLNDIARDMQNPVICQPLEEETVKAKSIKVASKNLPEKEFYFTKDPLMIYSYNASLGGYQELPLEDPYYELVQNAIFKK